MKGSLEVETVPAPVCPVCGSTGEILYRDLPDKLFGASGVSTFKRCVGCDGLWLDPIPRDLRRYYQFYHTHLDPVSLQIFNPRSLLRLTQESSFDRCRVHTTNRSAGYVFGMSAAQEQSRSHATSLSMISWRAISFQIFGRLLNIFLREAGEEIILSARKP